MSLRPMPNQYSTLGLPTGYTTITPPTKPWDEQTMADRLKKQRASMALIEALKNIGTQNNAVVGRSSDSFVAGPTDAARINVSGRSMEHANPVYANIGAPIEKVGGAYFAKKAQDRLQKEQEALNAQQDQTIMETLGNDEETKKLVTLARMGVPGASEALAEKMNPKKEALAGLLQFLGQGGDPALARELATKYGLDPAQVEQAAIEMRKRKEADDAREQQQAIELRRTEASLKSPSEFELFQRDPEGYARFKAAGNSPDATKRDLRAELADAIQRGDEAKIKAITTALEAGRRQGVGAGEDRQLTPGELQQRGKALQEFDKQLQNLGPNLSPAAIEQMDAVISDPSNFTTKNRIAEELSRIGDAAGARGVMGAGPITRAIATPMKSPGANAMDSFFMRQTLTDMAMLGGSDSNEELAKIRSQYPSVLNSQEGAKVLWDNFKRWQAITERSIQLKRERMQSGEYFTDKTASNNGYYRQAEQELVASGAISPKMKEIPSAGKQSSSGRSLSDYNFPPEMGVTQDDLDDLPESVISKYRRK